MTDLFPLGKIGTTFASWVVYSFLANVLDLTSGSELTVMATF